ncbi:MAG: PepSY domain-containing protein [Methylococcaceae bacterium]|nr:PepSY domain-containing protein [Methylococcaceae bacterium]
MAMGAKTGRMQNARGLASKRLSRRKLWLKIHLWLGLSIGAVWVLMGITGSINVFRWDIDEWLNPVLVVAHPGASPQSLDSILETLRAAHPGRTGTWSLEMPRHRAGMVMARHFQTQSNGDTEVLFVSVNPYTADIVANRFYSDFGFLVTWIYDLHSTFFLGDTGSYLSGVFGLLLMVSLGIGVYLWWPRTGKFRQALTLKRHASSERLNYDIHKLFGIYGLLVLFTVAFSGACLVFSEYVRPAVAWLSPVYGGFNPQPPPPEGLKSMPTSQSKSISLELAMSIAKHVFPEAEVRFIKTPANTEGFYGIQMRQPHEASLFFTSTSVWIDQYSGKVLAIRDPSQFTTGETFLNLMWPLHNGEALGLIGRILVCITGFIPLILYITGIVRWLQKRSIRPYDG